MATILVVDDEPHIREIVGSYLAREGHAVRYAADGETAHVEDRAGVEAFLELHQTGAGLAIAGEERPLHRGR